MKYTEGTIGRVFVIKFDHGDDFQKEITRFCKEKDIRAGQIQIIGAIKKTRVVVGPKEDVLPPEPEWKNIEEPKEVMGFGTVFWIDKDPIVHIHAVFSRHENGFIGCVRNAAEVFLVIEAIIMEINNVSVSRFYDEMTGLKLMHIDG